jgi:hypothetical protein
MIFNMKTKIFQKAAKASLISFLALFSVACQSAGTPAGGNASPVRATRDFTSVVKTRTVFLYPDAPDTSPKLEIALALLDSPRENRRFILDALYDGLDMDGYAEKRLLGYDKMYGEMRYVAERIPDMSALALNWYYNEALAHTVGTSKLTVISREWEYYTGGAHGMRNKDYYVFSMGEKRRLALKDVLRDEARPALGDLVEIQLRKHMGIPSWIPLSEQGFFENTVEKLEDFFLTPKGLGFQWDPYEIAPYSMGIIEIIIPYNDLQGMLTVLGLSLIKDLR